MSTLPVSQLYRRMSPIRVELFRVQELCTWQEVRISTLIGELIVFRVCELCTEGSWPRLRWAPAYTVGVYVSRRLLIWRYLYSRV